QMRNLMTTLLISQGCPMLLHGDEMGRTQQGNNNTYCQDNELSWVDWEGCDPQMLDFTRRLIDLRHSQPVLRRQRFFQGQVGRGVRRKDLAWFRRDGEEMHDDDWGSDQRQSLGMLLNGELIPERGPRGEPMSGDTLLVLLHGGAEDTLWRLPHGWGTRWDVILDSANPEEPAGERSCRESQELQVAGRSVVVLRRVSSSTA
ncbi:MAG TPA: glycogen debranching enzyme, partial [Candidatus Dormibacteraeota bacterium]